MPSEEWNIKPRGTVCGECQAPFADQQPCVSCLSFGETGYDRSDFCAGCWARHEESGRPVSVWKGVFKAPKPPPEDPIKKETAESLLRGMIEDNDVSRRNVIFILAVMLERRRTLVEKDVQERDDGSRLRIYEHRGTGETFVIVDPMLHLDQLQLVQKEVMAILSDQGSPPRADPPVAEEGGGRGTEDGGREG